MTRTHYIATTCLLFVVSLLSPACSPNASADDDTPICEEDATCTDADRGADTADAGVDAPDAQTLSPLTGPRRVIFGRLPPQPDAPDWKGEFRLIYLENQGSSPVEIDEISISGSDRFQVSFPQPTAEERADNAAPNPDNDTDTWPTTLASGDRVLARVWFAPQESGPEAAELLIESNGPDDLQHVISLSGNTGASCLRVASDEQVDFEKVPVGETAQTSVAVENCSRNAMLELSDVQLTDEHGVFALGGQGEPGDVPDQAATIEPGERANMVVTFTPTSEASYAGQLTIRSDDATNSPSAIVLAGEGSDGACPSAEATAWVQEGDQRATNLETTPLGTIMLDGSGSTAPGGTVERYEWTILSQPKGSTQRLQGEPNSATPRLFLDMVGTYRVGLHVFDAEGIRSCAEPAVITIVATPADDVYLELVWDTPSDLDQTDTYGNDLALHYKHENGVWESAPWDIFWRNSHQDWGVEDDFSDDPILDVEDIDGAGPEVISHDKPEEATYRVGVFNITGRTLRGNYATLRVFVEGALALELENRYLAQTGDFWEAALIEWPEATVTDISQVHWRFPESP